MGGISLVERQTFFDLSVGITLFQYNENSDRETIWGQMEWRRTSLQREQITALKIQIKLVYQIVDSGPTPASVG